MEYEENDDTVVNKFGGLEQALSVEPKIKCMKYFLIVVTILAFTGALF